MNIRSSLVNELRCKEYRESFVASEISVGLPFQIRALRKSRKLTQPELAKLAGMSQPRISELETPGARNLSLDTLQRIAAAFDVALQVCFVSFGTLVQKSEATDLENLYIAGFVEEIEDLVEAPIRAASAICDDQLAYVQEPRKVVSIDDARFAWTPAATMMNPTDERGGIYGDIRSGAR